MAGVDPRRRGVNSKVTEGMPKETKEEVKGSRPTHVDRILETILDSREFEARQCRRIKGADPDSLCEQLPIVYLDRVWGGLTRVIVL